MNLVGLCTAIALSVWPALAANPPRVQWTKRFVGWGKASGHCVQQTADGGYVAAGETNSTDSTSEMAILLVKVDSLGTTEWQKTVRAAGKIEANSVLQTADGGYVMTGMGHLEDGAPGRVCLVKTDAQGNVLWRCAVNRVAFARGYSVVEMNDQGFAVVAQWPATDSGLLLYRTDSFGGLRWWRQYPVAYPSCQPRTVSLRKTSDGGFIIGTKGLLKVDSLGNMHWLRIFDDVACVNSVIQTPDGGYVATGSPRGYNGVNLFKTDADGNPQWGKTYSSSKYDQGNWVEQLADGGYVVAGSVEDSTGEALLIRTKSNGAMLWQKALYDEGEAQCVRQARDGGYIVTGWYNNPSMDKYGTQCMFLTKLAPEGK